MRNRLLAALALAPLVATPASGQQPQPPAAAPPLAIGAVAPDFALPAATRYGVLKDPVKLSDFRGKTVVLAFFFHARTPG